MDVSTAKRSSTVLLREFPSQPSPAVAIFLRFRVKGVVRLLITDGVREWRVGACIIDFCNVDGVDNNVGNFTH